MDTRLSEALIVLALGSVGLYGSIQLDRQVGALSLAVTMGPGRYGAVVSAIVLACGVLLGVQALRQRDAARADGAGPLASRRGALLVAVLLAYVAAVPLLGFTPGNVCFFPLLFHVCGMRPWPRSLVSGLVMSAAFHVVFIRLARIPVPKGWLSW